MHVGFALNCIRIIAGRCIKISTRIGTATPATAIGRKLTVSDNDNWVFKRILSASDELVEREMTFYRFSTKMLQSGGFQMSIWNTPIPLFWMDVLINTNVINSISKLWHIWTYWIEEAKMTSDWKPKDEQFSKCRNVFPTISNKYLTDTIAVHEHMTTIMNCIENAWK